MRIILLLVALVLILPSHSFSSQEIIAKIGDKVITKADLDRIISYYPKAQQKNITGNSLKQKEVMERYIQGIVVSRLAKKKGFDKTESIKERLDFIINDYLATQYIQQEVMGKKIDVTDKEAEEYYNKYKEEFTSPEMVKVRHILIKAEKNKPENERKIARGKAEELLKRIKAGGDFAKLALEFSDDPGSKAKGGELDFFPRGAMVPEFEKSAFSLKAGEVSNLVETQFGYHIIKAEGSKEPEVLPFEKITEKVKIKAKDRLRNDRMKEFLDKAYGDAGVEIYPDALKKK